MKGVFNPHWIYRVPLTTLVFLRKKIIIIGWGFFLPIILIYYFLHMYFSILYQLYFYQCAIRKWKWNKPNATNSTLNVHKINIPPNNIWWKILLFSKCFRDIYIKSDMHCCMYKNQFRPNFSICVIYENNKMQFKQTPNDDGKKQTYFIIKKKHSHTHTSNSNKNHLWWQNVIIFTWVANKIENIHASCVAPHGIFFSANWWGVSIGASYLVQN